MNSTERLRNENDERQRKRQEARKKALGPFASPEKAMRKLESLEKALREEGPSPALWKKMENFRTAFDNEFRSATFLWFLGFVAGFITLGVVCVGFGRISIPLIVATLFCLTVIVIKLFIRWPWIKRCIALIEGFSAKGGEAMGPNTHKAAASNLGIPIFVIMFFGFIIGLASCIVLYRRNMLPGWVLGLTIFYMDMCLLIGFLWYELRKPPEPEENSEEQPPVQAVSFTENPPRANVEESDWLRGRAGKALISAVVTLILLGLFLTRDVPSFLLYVLGLTSLTLFLLALRWQQKSKALSQPIPLASWTNIFSAKGHSIEIAFQLPGEFNRADIRERIQIGTRAAVRDFTPEELQEKLERNLSRDVTELNIPVFRIQILSVDPSEPGKKVVIDEDVELGDLQ
jgi:hypothetical protein